MKAVQRPDDTSLWDLAPGEWCWYHVDNSRRGGPADQRAFCFHTPNPSDRAWGLLNHHWPDNGRWWQISGDGDTITVSPSIFNNPGAGKDQGRTVLGNEVGGHGDPVLTLGA